MEFYRKSDLALISEAFKAAVCAVNNRINSLVAALGRPEVFNVAECDVGPHRRRVSQIERKQDVIPTSAG